MQRNKRNILYVIIAALVIIAIGFFVAIASVFWVIFYLIILLVVKIKRAGRNKIPAHQLN